MRYDVVIHPYRDSPPTPLRSRPVPREELIFYIGLCVVGAIPVATALHDRSDGFGVEPTIGLMMIIAGIAGLYALRRAVRRRLEASRTASIDAGHAGPGSVR